ncbi:carboxypeptidase family protein [Edaphobacter aggregans]|uniref:Carboxypeptidase family protein n=1 Tax=Edaphobacter aggregans TaxID=570835 RepID=A0A428MFH1_9BACT|nr:TonB-dependent receptor [Edaphobacter aggregans]RSL15626.1 carboxypeptidase family protein [Edaphobacter aggregans]
MTQFWKKHLRILLTFLIAFPAFGQTFRGTVSGTVLDTQGAVITDAAVVLVNPATGVALNAKSGKTGDFLFPELPVGTYQLTVSFSGFRTQKIDNIDVAVSKIVDLKVELSVGAEAAIVDVNASGVTTDTTSSALVTVIDSKSVQEMPMNGRNFTQMIKFAPGVNISSSVNGSRTASINYQVDGVDNVDAYLGIVASNQGGIQSIAGGLIPIEAIDQFSMQSGGEADQGRNAGANSNMVLKSGTNKIHGDVFYFDRNEFFASISPFAAVGSRKPLIRNHQGGFTLGGPIWKDHTFLFLAGEIQVAKANVALTDTVLTDAWIAQAKGFMANFGVAVNPVSQNLYNLLYPANSKSGPATANNYFASGASNYNSFNGVIKLDHKFSDKYSISLHYIGTTGKQTAPTGSDYAQYFQTAPMHIHNASIVQTSVFNSHLLNIITFGTNYFKQTFNDADQNFNPQQNAGLNLGLNGIIAAGAPTLTVSGFDITGATQPSGRTDVTGHVVDNLHWTLGRHALKFGGEFRRADVDLLYFSNARGSFSFDGTRGPWDTAAGALTPAANAYCAANGLSANCSSLSYIGDFLAGMPTNASGAKLLQGNAERIFLLNTIDSWAQDDFQATRKLTLNLGVRYTVPGVVHDAANDLYSFVPGTTPAFQVPLYKNYYGSFGPRFGFAYSPFDDNTTVIRGSYGLFYDVPGMSAMVSGTTTNGGDSYTQNNPAGPHAAVTYIASNVTFATNINPFVGANPPQLGAFGVNPNIKTPYAETYSLGIEQQLSKSTLVTVGYVGTVGHRLLALLDLNQPVANGTSTASARPYQQLSFPGQTITTGKSLAGINQLDNAADSNFNSLQVVIKQAPWHGIQTTFNYTWAHSLDDNSSTTTPMNSYNIHQDYGNSTFDTRNTVTGFVYYDAPQLFHVMPRVSKGWQLNALYTFSGGTPISPLVSTDNSATKQLKDRPNFTGVNPFAGRTVITAANGTRQYQYLLQGSAYFSTPTPGTYGNLQRDNFYGPGFGAVDFSLFKHTAITERIMSEFRIECFNIMNQANLANPSVSNINSATTFGRITQTRNGAGAPGLGYGEPRNVQFALKLQF